MEKYTFAEMRAKNKEIEHHWFDEGAMKFFNTEIESGVMDYNMFITSDRMDESYDKAYCIRIFSPKGNIETIGNLRDFDNIDEANKMVKTFKNAFDSMSERQKLILENLHDVSIDRNMFKFMGILNGTDESFFISI